MTASPPPKPNLDQLLRMGVRAARAGNQSAARALFRSLANEHPGDVRVWLGLAGVAVSQDEQGEALARVIAIDPQHPQARQALERLDPPPPAGDPGPPLLAQAPPAPIATDDEPARADGPAAPRPRFPLLNRIALAIIALLLVALAAQALRIVRGPAGEPTPLAPSPELPGASVAATPAPSPPPAASATPQPAPATAAPAGRTAVAQASPAAGMPAPPTLPLGTVLEADGWSATLLRPDYALLLDGSIGDLQPNGRFVLALVAVSNNAAQARRLPIDLFTLVDSRGRRYSPAPNVSSAYLALYGRGQRGDLALEDSLDPGSGMRGVPVLFDVPADAAGLVLTVGGAGARGWPISSLDAPPPVSGP